VDFFLKKYFLTYRYLCTIMSSAQIINDTAIRTIRIEIDALEALAQAISATPDFTECVKAIAASSGRLVVTGIGKSASVAQKMVATLNSTGQPALFLHAADAIHGDIGMVQPNDLVLCISKSGETPEIKVLVPLVKNFGNPLIAMTANRDSFLAQQSDHLLWTPIEKEADPNNLAPTASTTSQIALGDALATALVALRGFTPADFARYHPGGALGKQLYLRVKDLCAMHGKPIVPATATLPEILLEMSAKRLGATAVTNTNGQITGIITDGDLRRMLERESTSGWGTLTAHEIQTPNPQTITPDAMAIDALEILRARSISQLLVLDDAGNYEGMIHLHDLVREGII
jgi:arabinose-5-phosphate isomerase